MSNARESADYLRTAVSLQQFFVRGDATNETSKIQAALDSGAHIVWAPAAEYSVTGVTVPSNCELKGEGWSTIFAQRAAADQPVITVAGTASNVRLSDFKVDGNSATQTTGLGTVDGILVAQGASNVEIHHVWTDDVKDWGFSIQGSIVTLRDCKGSNVTGPTGPNGVRAPYLIGSSVPSIAANNIVLDNCVVTNCPTDNVDGYVFENGTDIKVVNCRCEGVQEHTGFKIKTNNTILIGNYANNPTASCGFQTQGPLQNLTMIGNIAYRNGGAGFQFNQSDTVTPGRNWVLIGNQGIENGQLVAAGFRYGFNFDNAANCITDGMVLVGNIAVDNQVGKTQIRGFSWGSNAGAIYRRCHVAFNMANGNTAAGPTVDWLIDYTTTSFEFSTSALGPNYGLSGSSAGRVSAGNTKRSLNFWTDNVVAGAGPTILMNSLTGVNGRGYVMPRAGWVIGVYSRSTAAVTAGQVSYRTLKNGVPFASGLVHNAAAGQVASNEEPPWVQVFAAGDIINLDITPNAGLLPTGTNDFDVTVDVFY